MGNMTEQEVRELAAILINEHGHAAIKIAQRRRDQHKHERDSDAFRLWGRITEATRHLLRRWRLAEAEPEASRRKSSWAGTTEMESSKPRTS